MTENEAIRDLQYLIEEYSAYPPETGVNETIGSLQYCITALREIQQYREIGTVEECREAVEKQEPKKPIPINHKEYADKIVNAEFLEDAYLCPNCKTVIRSGSHCGRCGQKLNWNLVEEAQKDLDEYARKKGCKERLMSLQRQNMEMADLEVQGGRNGERDYCFG